MKIEHAYILYIDNPESIQYMEECMKSCKEHGIPATPFKGFKLPTTVKEVYDTWGLKIDPRAEEKQNETEVFRTWFKEQLCLTGHLAMWKKIAAEHKNAVAILEHDAIVKRNFLDVDVSDLEWVFLGYRVDHRDDYECISDPFEKMQIRKFEGTHAYALTPRTAESCLNALDNFHGNRGYLPYGVSIDHMMGVQNGFKLPLFVVDPAPVVAAIEQKISYTQYHEKTARYNIIPHSGFVKGLAKGIHKYKIDKENGWLIF